MARVRPMTAADIPAVSKVHVRSWRDAYRGMIPQQHLDGLSTARNERVRRARFGTDDRVEDLVVEGPGGSVVGWACLGPYRSDEGEDPAFADDGELYALYLSPEVAGRGYGRALSDEVLARARRRGFPWLRLWVLEANARARRFYERAGFAPDGAREPFTVAGVDVPEVRYAMRLGRWAR